MRSLAASFGPRHLGIKGILYDHVEHCSLTATRIEARALVNSRKIIPLIFCASALLTGSVMFLMMEIADRTLAANAERTSMTWADYISSRMTDIKATVSGERLA